MSDQLDPEIEAMARKMQADADRLYVALGHFLNGSPNGTVVAACVRIITDVIGVANDDVRRVMSDFVKTSIDTAISNPAPDVNETVN